MPTVTMLCHDSPTRDSCPTLYRTDQGNYYVQGYTETDRDVLSQMDIPEGETVVRITAGLLKMIAEAYAAAEPNGTAVSGGQAMRDMAT
jgi:hypothetical protein